MNDFYASSRYEVISVNSATKVRFYTSRDPGSYVAPHWHDALEIVYLQSGELSFGIEGNERKLVPGECVLVNPNIVHTTKCVSPNVSIVFQIPLDFLDTMLPNIRQRFFTLDISNNKSQITILLNTLERMQLLNDERPEGYLPQFNSLLYWVIYLLYSEFSIKIIHADFEHRSQIMKRLLPILNYTYQHYNETISINEIASVAAMQPSYFCRFFKKYMHITFLGYQNELRMSRIIRDMISTDNSISEILECHGFTNYKVFLRLFHEKFGCTPSKMRKKLKDSSRNSLGKKGE